MKPILVVLGIITFSLLLYGVVMLVLCWFNLRWLNAQLKLGNETFRMSEAPWYMRLSELVQWPLAKLTKLPDAEIKDAE